MAAEEPAIFFAIFPGPAIVKNPGAKKSNLLTSVLLPVEISFC